MATVCRIRVPTFLSFFVRHAMTVSTHNPPFRSTLSISLAAGALVTLCWFLLTWRYGFDFADEGYYWYGAQRVLRGEAPIRDFLAYDIGRYLWAAGVMALIGDDGMFGARAAAGLFQGLSVCLGVFLVLQALDASLRTAGKILLAVAVALILNLWVIPYYKVYDFGAAILVVAMLVLMLGAQTPARWFGAGVILGLTAVIGRNHGLYGAASGLLALAFLAFKTKRPTVLLLPALACIAGTVVGFSPNFLMALAKPGFFDAFMASVIEHVHSTTGATNIPLPVPWPWTVAHGKDGWMLWASKVAIGAGFIALLLVPALAILALLRKRLADFTRLDYLTLAAAFTALMYAHYAYSRADLVHLAVSLLPVILLLLAATVRMPGKFAVLAGMLGVSVLMLLQDVPLLDNKVLGRKMKTVEIGGSMLHVQPFIADYIADSDAAFASVPGARANFLALPNFPGLHAHYKAKMGIYEIYALSARSAAFEESELARLDGMPPQVVLLSNHGLDRKSDLRYSSMHPLTYRWILDHYRRVEVRRSQNLEIYVKK